MTSLLTSLFSGAAGSLVLYELASGGFVGAGWAALAAVDLLLSLYWLAVAIVEVG